MRRSYLIPLLLAALLCGCTQEAAANSTASHSDTATSSANTDIFSARDLEIGYDADTAALVTLSGDALAVGASYCVTCGDSESTVTLDRLLYSDISSSFFGGRGQRP